MKKRNDEINKRNEKERLELKKKEEALYEEARKKKINIDKLDKIIDKCGNVAEAGGTGVAGGVLVTLGGAALTTICPIAGPMVMSFGLGLIGGGGISVAGAGVLALGAKIKKEIDS
jgi:hypothetical protein